MNAEKMQPRYFATAPIICPMGVSNVVGWITYVRAKGRSSEGMEYLHGLSILKVTFYEPEGLSPRRLERRLERLERTFRRAGVCRVILPAGFPHKERLKWVQPVEPLTFYRAIADVLTLGWLDARHIPPERGRVALSAPRLCPELREAALRLCPVVRELRIDVPGEEGEFFARELQRSVGLPVVPPTAPVDVTVSFGPGAGADLRLWGPEPCLGGQEVAADGLELDRETAPQLLALLWEGGRLRRESVFVRKAL